MPAIFALPNSFFAYLILLKQSTPLLRRLCRPRNFLVCIIDLQSARLLLKQAAKSPMISTVDPQDRLSEYVLSSAQLGKDFDSFSVLHTKS
jgi:hypothetical protein